MENKNMSYTSRTERKKIEEMQIKREKELEERRKEIKNILFDDDIKKPKKIKKENNTNDIKKPKAANIFLSITYVAAIFLFIFLILDSANQINQIYQIINAFLILFIVTSFLVSFKKSFFKNKSFATVTTSLLVLITITFNGLYMTKVIKLPTQNFLPDFESKNLTKAINWTEENNIKSEQNFEYSDTEEKYSIISQSKKPETLTKNIKKVDFTVSNGPDYNKDVILTDMTSWNVDDVLKFIDNNFLNSVAINFEENLNIKKDTVISQSNTGNIKRNTALIFNVSLGDKNSLKPIKLKDLKNESLLQAEVYLGRNGILYELKYDFSNTIKKGNVITSSIKEGTTVKPDEKITLTISKGKEIKVPNLKNKTMSYITKWMVENNIQINYKDRYDNNIKSGRVIESNYKEGDIIEEGTTVDIIFSKGPLVMKKFDNINDFKSWADTNGIKYEIKEEFNEEIEKDKIIKTSIEEGKNINLEETITVYVSKGIAVKVPNFIGKSKSEVQKECDNLGINCSFTESYSTKTKGTVIAQNINAGTEISKGDTIVITLATNKKTNNKTSTSSSSSRPSNSSSNNSSSSGGNTGGNSNANQCDKTKTKQVWLNASDSFENTKKLIQNQNQGIKFQFKKANPGYGTTGSITIETTEKYDGKYLNYCDTYIIYIIVR